MRSFKSFINEADRCWTGYKPVPGKKPYSPGSCKKEETDINEDGGAGAAAAAGPTVVTGGVAGIGAQGPNSNQSEPGVYNDKRKKKSPILMGMARRKPPKA